ncbi:MAG: DoxX family protein [Bacteroidia bacterium]|nr:DoxX family protein [Bacteroidia bacterium]MCF8426829.1 DoxX family protein [Bacteroidia bacterium]MCF8446803.1 DoxX family protein [Bacteroidia bacterium]
MKWITQISRILVGVLFIISGLIKANDTLGFSYKLLEYFEIFQMQFLDSYAVAFSMVICIFEIVSGVALLLGVYNKLNAWLLLLLIAFFTLLTGYSAITHKVTDCGCFGDALKLKPFESFMKDVVLLILILFIFFGTKYLQPLFNKVILNISLFVAILVSTFFTFYTFMFLPVKDFLPYKIGNNIKELTLFPENAERDVVEMIFVYEKAGQTFEFTANTLPEDIDQYNFVDRKDKVIKEGFKPPIHDFKVFDENGLELTDSLFAGTDYKILLVQTKLNESRTGLEEPIRALSNEFIKNGFQFWALTSNNLEEAKTYCQENKFGFKYSNMDAIPLKSMVRSNPGILLLKGNVVVKKWGAYNLPTYSTLQKYMN